MDPRARKALPEAKLADRSEANERADDLPSMKEHFKIQTTRCLCRVIVPTNTLQSGQSFFNLCKHIAPACRTVAVRFSVHHLGCCKRSTSASE